MVNSKHAFWQALVFSVIIFVIGLIIGFFIEQRTADQFQLEVINSEINLLDQQIRTFGIQQFNISCEIAKESTFNFANQIYSEAVQLEKYESQSKFTDTLKILHKRYDLLRVMLWSESIKLKQNCGNNFHTLVYIYEYNPEDVEIRAKQAALSRMLIDLKNKRGDEILLIPIAGNMNLESVNIIKKDYKISKLPVIIIDEKIIIREMPTSDELEKTIFHNL